MAIKYNIDEMSSYVNRTRSYLNNLTTQMNSINRTVSSLNSNNFESINKYMKGEYKLPTALIPKVCNEIINTNQRIHNSYMAAFGVSMNQTEIEEDIAFYNAEIWWTERNFRLSSEEKVDYTYYYLGKIRKLEAHLDLLFQWNRSTSAQFEYARTLMAALNNSVSAMKNPNGIVLKTVSSNAIKLNFLKFKIDSQISTERLDFLINELGYTMDEIEALLNIEGADQETLDFIQYIILGDYDEMFDLDPEKLGTAGKVALADYAARLNNLDDLSELELLTNSLYAKVDSKDPTTFKKVDEYLSSLYAASAILAEMSNFEIGSYLTMTQEEIQTIIDKNQNEHQMQSFWLTQGVAFSEFRDLVSEHKFAQNVEHYNFKIEGLTKIPHGDSYLHQFSSFHSTDIFIPELNAAGLLNDTSNHKNIPMWKKWVSFTADSPSIGKFVINEKIMEYEKAREKLSEELFSDLLKTGISAITVFYPLTGATLTAAHALYKTLKTPDDKNSRELIKAELNLKKQNELLSLDKKHPDYENLKNQINLEYSLLSGTLLALAKYDVSDKDFEEKIHESGDEYMILYFGTYLIGGHQGTEIILDLSFTDASKTLERLKWEREGIFAEFKVDLSSSDKKIITDIMESEIKKESNSSNFFKGDTKGKYTEDDLKDAYNAIVYGIEGTEFNSFYELNPFAWSAMTTKVQILYNLLFGEYGTAVQRLTGIEQTIKDDLGIGTSSGTIDLQESTINKEPLE